VCPFGHALDARSLIQNLAVRSHLDSLPVRCPQHDDIVRDDAQVFCTWTGMLQDVDWHEGECPRAVTRCRWSGCGDTMERHEVQYHEQQVCAFRTVACPHAGCNKRKPPGAMRDHAAQCKHAALACANNCGVVCRRSDMARHLEGCTRLVLCCVPDCGMRVERDAMHEHLRDEAVRHFTLQDGQRRASDKRAGDAEGLQLQAEGRATLLAAEVAALKRELAAQKVAHDAAAYASQLSRDIAATKAAIETARQRAAAAAAAAAATPAGRRLRRNAGPAVSAHTHGQLNTRCPLSGQGHHGAEGASQVCFSYGWCKHRSTPLTPLTPQRNSDSKGYVFEKAAIVAYINSKSNGDANTRVQSPIAGAWLLPALACMPSSAHG
jgi:hypothetical protein